MSDAFQPSLDFQAADVAAEDGEALIVDLDGYEGPLHVLLALATSRPFSSVMEHSVRPTVRPRWTSWCSRPGRT